MNVNAKGVPAWRQEQHCRFFDKRLGMASRDETRRIESVILSASFF